MKKPQTKEELCKQLHEKAIKNIIEIRDLVEKNYTLFSKFQIGDAITSCVNGEKFTVVGIKVMVSTSSETHRWDKTNGGEFDIRVTPLISSLDRPEWICGEEITDHYRTNKHGDALDPFVLTCEVDPPSPVFIEKMRFLISNIWKFD